MKVISFSLYGNNPIYTIGAIKNAELAKKFFPGWEVWIYKDNTVPSVFLEELQYNNCRLIDRKGNGFMNSLWRFEPILDPNIECFISRDCDSRLSERDKIAVDEWIDSGKDFHIIRDHPHGHGWVMNAGMWGAKGGCMPEFIDLLNEFTNRGIQLEDKTLDQIFLRDYIYPRIVNRTFIHDEYFKYENHSQPIKQDRKINDFQFIGESIDENNIPRGDQRSSIKERYYA